MTPQATYSGPDPLEWARRQLDFEALSKSGPTTREVLFKAQTIVPYARPRLTTRTTVKATAVGLLAALVFVPWIPQHAMLSTTRIDITKRLTRPEAQTAVNKVAQSLPQDILLGAQFTTPKGSSDEAPGALELAFTAFDKRRDDFTSEVSQAVSSTQKGLQGQRPHSLDLVATKWRSPAAIARTAAANLGHKRVAVTRPGQALSDALILHQDLVVNGIRARLETAGFNVTSAGYIDASGTGSGCTYDITLDAWPQQFGLNIESYSTLDGKERNAVHQRAQEYLDLLNLGPGLSALTDQPQLWLPVMVEVRQPNGAPDRLVSGLVQAQITQPTASELSTYSFDVVQLVDEALKRILPEEECRIDYETLPGAGFGILGDLYKVTVSLTGKRIAVEREFRGADAAKEEENLEY
jgi:hypothetical protein